MTATASDGPPPWGADSTDARAHGMDDEMAFGNLMAADGMVLPGNAALAVGCALMLYAARFAELGTRRATTAGVVLETGTLRWFIGVGLLLLGLGVAEMGWRGARVSWWGLGLGWAVGLTSFVVRRRAIAALGRFWSLHVEIRAEHEFVRTGPFRWVRHPAYFSMILELLAIGLILGAPLALLVAYALLAPVLRRRIRLEEEALRLKFGPAYEAYLRQVPALIPYKGKVLV